MKKLFDYMLDKKQQATLTEYFGNQIDIEIPETIDGNPVVAIGCDIFADNTSLNSVVIPDCIKTICEDAFGGCSNLTKVILSPKSQLTKIDEYAFFGCTRLSNFFVPNKLKSIGDYAFANCTNLTIIDFSQNSAIANIGWNAFEKCTSLQTSI